MEIHTWHALHSFLIELRGLLPKETCWATTIAALTTSSIKNNTTRYFWRVEQSYIVSWWENDVTEYNLTESEIHLGRENRTWYTSCKTSEYFQELEIANIFRCYCWAIKEELLFESLTCEIKLYNVAWTWKRLEVKKSIDMS